VYASSTSALATGSNLVFDGTNLGLGVTPSAWYSTGGYYAGAIQIGSRGSIASTYALGTGYFTNSYSSNSGFTQSTLANGYSPFYLQTSTTGQHQWYTTANNSSGANQAVSGVSQAMTLDNSGNLGIGTTSPALPLTVQSGASTQIRCRSTTTRYRTSWGIDTSGNTTIDSYDDSGSVYTLITINGNPLKFSISGTEAARITASGGFSVGTTADPGAGAIYATGNITAYYSSDAKFKENVQDIPDALEIVTAIGSKIFDWTDDYLKNHGGENNYFLPKSSFGVIAQDVERVFSRATRTRADGSLAVDYEKLSTLSFGAIAQLLKRLEALEAK